VTDKLRQRFIVCGFGSTFYAISFDEVEYVVTAPPKVMPWQGSDLLQGYVAYAGTLVWIMGFHQIYTAEAASKLQPTWLVVLKGLESGLSNTGFFAEAVRGPLSASRLGKVRKLNKRPNPVT